MNFNTSGIRNRQAARIEAICIHMSVTHKSTPAIKNRWELWGFQCGNISVAINYASVQKTYRNGKRKIFHNEQLCCRNVV